MDIKVGFLFLFMALASYVGNARELAASDSSEEDTRRSYVSVLQISHQDSEEEVGSPEEIGEDEQICILCKTFSVTALKYLRENKTQTEIIAILHKSCLQLQSFKHQCINLVDFYVPLFFIETHWIRPEDFCQKVDLCKQIASISRHVSQDSCGFCRQAVDEIILKLQDPDTRMEIIEVLLKGCNAVETYIKKCKRFVFEYGPLIIVNAEKFLQTNDVCTMLHACDPAEGRPEQDPMMARTLTISSS